MCLPLVYYYANCKIKLKWCNHIPGQIQAVRHTGQVVDQSFLKKEPYDIVHAVVLGLGCCCAIKTGRGGTRFHDSADDAHHCLKSVKYM